MEDLVVFNDLQNVYKNKKVFLTGHTGFKGSWLLKMLNLLGADVKGYSLAHKDEFDLYNVIGGNKICNSVIADLRDRQRLINEVKSFQPDFIFHLAAQPLVRLSYEMPVETFEINVIGTANLLEAVKEVNNKCQIVLITTDKVYHNYEWTYPYRENDRLGGYDPYSASKACSELVIDSYRNSFFNTQAYQEHGKAIAVGRAGNVIGGGDWAKDRLLPDIVRALGHNQSIKVRNPVSIRPWQHVMEPLFGYLLLGKALAQDPVKFSQAYNFGPLIMDALPVERMVKIAIDEWGEGAYEKIQQIHQPHEAGLLSLDISKAICELSWKPALNAQEAVSITIAWYKEYYNTKTDMVQFTEQQIRNFFSKQD